MNGCQSRRVAITGIGAVTPIGCGKDGLWNGVTTGRSAVRRITRFDPTPFTSQMAAQIDDFDPLDYVGARTARRMDRFALLGVAAAIQALQDSAFTLTGTQATRCGVSVGSALGGIAYAEEQHAEFVRDPRARAISPTLAIAVYGGASGANIAITLGFRGPNLAHASSCASGAIAIGEGMRQIRSGQADVMICGGVEAPLAPLTFGAFAVIRAMSTRNGHPKTASRPFDRDRDGFVMAEGAAMLVLEDREHAERRGAAIYGEVHGYGQSNDAYHMTAPRPDGSEAARAITLALCDARLSSEEVEYVNAHATGTPLGDVAESRALLRALGPRAESVAVSGTKGLHGHALGASGAIEAAITALALQHGHLPGTANLQHVDVDCPVGVLPPAGVNRRIHRAVSTSFGFGGVNAALVLGSSE